MSNTELIVKLSLNPCAVEEFRAPGTGLITQIPAFLSKHVYADGVRPIYNPSNDALVQIVRRARSLTRALEVAIEAMHDDLAAFHPLFLPTPRALVSAERGVL